MPCFRHVSIIAVLFALCAAAPACSTAFATDILTEKDAGTSPKTIAKGQSFCISLPANPTTGYSWAITTLPDFLEETKEAVYEQDTVASGMVGSGGRMTWYFKAIGTGKGHVAFAYARPWEKDIAPIQNASFEILVQ